MTAELTFEEANRVRRWYVLLDLYVPDELGQDDRDLMTKIMGPFPRSLMPKITLGPTASFHPFRNRSS